MVGCICDLTNGIHREGLFGGAINMCGLEPVKEQVGEELFLRALEFYGREPRERIEAL